jgi:hypothetical protein
MMTIKDSDDAIMDAQVDKSAKSAGELQGIRVLALENTHANLRLWRARLEVSILQHVSLSTNQRLSEVCTEGNISQDDPRLTVKLTTHPSSHSQPSSPARSQIATSVGKRPRRHTDGPQIYKKIKMGGTDRRISV